VRNPTYTLPTNAIDDATCAARLRQAEDLFDQEKYKECHDIANEMLGSAPNFIPARLLMGRFYRRVGPSEHMLKSFGAALGAMPFDPERHCDFAEALCEIGAHGAARMHYDQALALKQGDGRATAGIAYVDGPQVTDQQRGTYFVSWSDDLPPQRCQPAATIQVSSMSEMRQEQPAASESEPVSIFRKLTEWIKPR
jgi:tetratricopeptide (TPR) repeat protein